MTSLRLVTAVAALAAAAFVVPAGAVESQPPGQFTPRPGAAPAQATQPSERPPGQARRGGGSWDSMGMRGFSVSLVLGDLAGAATPDNLPAGAKKALSDMRDFLPYKSYRLLDTHWILCCSSVQSASVSGRLRGVEEEEYAFYIDVRPANEWSELAVRFNLRDTGTAAEHLVTSVVSAEQERRVAELKRERDEVARRSGQGGQADQAAARAQYEDMLRKVQESEHAAAQARRATTAARSGARNVLDSTFSMKVGETVVIGTSRLKGDKALIALLTAASRTATPPAAR